MTVPDPLEEERLLVEAARLDPGRFGALYEAHFERVYAYVVRRVRDRSEAEDVTAEVFQQALANIARFEWRGLPFVRWLFRIAANAIADRWHRRERERGIQADADRTEPKSEEVEAHASLFRLVDRLPADQQRVIHMRFVEQKAIREIAAELGRSEGAVKQLQFRAIAGLRERLGASHG